MCVLDLSSSNHNLVELSLWSCFCLGTLIGHWVRCEQKGYGRLLIWWCLVLAKEKQQSLDEFCFPSWEYQNVRTCFIVQEIFHSGMNPFRFCWKSEGPACNFPFICMPCIISFERLRLRKLRRLFCCYVSSSGAVGSISEAFAGQRCKMHQIWPHLHLSPSVFISSVRSRCMLGENQSWLPLARFCMLCSTFASPLLFFFTNVPSNLRG